MEERDAYAVLQVDPGADLDVIQAAYRALARRFHPDGREPDASRMAELNRAYEQLKTADLRRAYDQRRRQPVAVGPGRPAAPYDPWASGATRPATSNADPSTVIDFGRYEGWTIRDVARHDPDYLRWLSRHSTGVRYREAISACLPNDPAVGRRANVLG